MIPIQKTSIPWLLDHEFHSHQRDTIILMFKIRYWSTTMVRRSDTADWLKLIVLTGKQPIMKTLLILRWNFFMLHRWKDSELQWVYQLILRTSHTNYDMWSPHDWFVFCFYCHNSICGLPPPIQTHSVVWQVHGMSCDITWIRARPTQL